MTANTCVQIGTKDPDRRNRWWCSRFDAPHVRARYWGSVAQLVKRLLNTTPTPMGIADVHRHHPLAFPMLHDLDMRQRARNTVVQVGKAPSIRLATGPVGLSENLWEQADIAGFAIRE